MREKELLIYETPRAEVINIALEQAILNGSDPTGNIPDLEEEYWYN